MAISQLKFIIHWKRPRLCTSTIWFKNGLSLIKTKGMSVEKPWLSQYPEGVPAEIDVTEFKSVLDVFKNSCKKYADRTAFTCMGKSLTYAQLDALTRAFAA